MSTAAASVDDVMSVFPELRGKGPVSSGVLTVTALPLANDALTFGDADGECVLLTLTAVASGATTGQFNIGADESETATNIAAALDADARFTACAVGTIVYFDTVATGVVSKYTLTSSAPSRLTFTSSPMTGGAALADWAILRAANDYTASQWGARRTDATRLFAAHLIATLAGSGSGGSASDGPVASRTIDKLSVSYAVTAASDADLGRTKYGLALLSMLQSELVLPVVGAAVVEALPS